MTPHQLLCALAIQGGYRITDSPEGWWARSLRALPGEVATYLGETPEEALGRLHDEIAEDTAEEDGA